MFKVETFKAFGGIPSADQLEEFSGNLTIMIITKSLATPKLYHRELYS
jgi:hypothetical protein